MYDNTATWNPFKGCNFNCIYCKPSFQQQSKRWGKNNCKKCYNYEPHFHPERLDRIPSADIIFVCGSGDISFATDEQVDQIIKAIKDHNPRKDKTYYFQSKNPKTFKRFKDKLPDNCVLITTIETDKDEFQKYSEENDYFLYNYKEHVSKAPLPRKRLADFWEIEYPRKVITIEPIMRFSYNFSAEIKVNKPEYVWIGFNTRPEQVDIPEPSEDQVKRLIKDLMDAGIEVKGKDLRSINLESMKE